MANQMRKRGEGLRPFKTQTIQNAPGWPHGVTPQRFAAPLPSSVKGPVPGRQVRADKGLPTPPARKKA